MKKSLDELAKEIEINKEEIAKVGVKVHQYNTWLERQIYLFHKQGRRFDKKYEDPFRHRSIRYPDW